MQGYTSYICDATDKMNTITVCLKSTSRKNGSMQLKTSSSKLLQFTDMSSSIVSAQAPI